MLLDLLPLEQPTAVVSGGGLRPYPVYEPVRTQRVTQAPLPTSAGRVRVRVSASGTGALYGAQTVALVVRVQGTPSPFTGSGRGAVRTSGAVSAVPLRVRAAGRLSARSSVRVPDRYLMPDWLLLELGETE